MEKLDGRTRRTKIIEILKAHADPVSGNGLAKLTGVSRQVIVQDITLLRTEYPILATARGYLLYPMEERQHRRTYLVKHADDRVREELYTIVDLGGKVLNVIVEHDVYGQITADMMLSCRRDVDEFCALLERSRSGPLNVLADGKHIHTVEAASEETLLEIEKALRDKKILI